MSPPRRFDKVLVANRGEIAVRVIRACREAGLASVAVYSEADREALHVRLADEAVPIGPAPSVESYLRVDRLLEAARATRAGAVHPGYGFLSENAAFARACEEAGLAFVGPRAETIALMGEKTSARREAQAAGLPVVPGTLEPLADPARLALEAESIGLPLMLKAAAGGGGKGMRLVSSAEELEAAFARARAEARGAFGDDRIYLERALLRPRHVEVQVLADEHGQVVHLFDRECSVQRRHQKLIEESPAPALDPPTRARLGELAVALARRVGYRGAGTLEFLLDADGQPYFLEMNTRIQVEHPVTELVTGIDLVRRQLGIAQGEPLGLRQDAIVQRGHAIECRICAEDPDHDFLPSPGRIVALRAASGPGVREDSGVYEGWRVPAEYDPLLSKLCVWGETRRQAIERLQRALGEYRLLGVRTTLPFFEQALRHPAFVRGETDTGFVDTVRSDAAPAEPRAEAVELAIAAAAIRALRESRSRGEDAGRPLRSAWAQAARRGAVGP